VSKTTSLGCYLRRLKDLLVKQGFGEVRLHALSAAIPHAILVLHSLVEILPFPKGCVGWELKSGSVKCFDEKKLEVGGKGGGNGWQPVLFDDDEDDDYRARGKAQEVRDGSKEEVIAGVRIRVVVSDPTLFCNRVLFRSPSLVFLTHILPTNIALAQSSLEIIIRVGPRNDQHTKSKQPPTLPPLPNDPQSISKPSNQSNKTTARTATTTTTPAITTTPAAVYDTDVSKKAKKNRPSKEARSRKRRAAIRLAEERDKAGAQEEIPKDVSVEEAKKTMEGQARVDDEEEMANDV
jgi:hypothetical protein